MPKPDSPELAISEIEKLFLAILTDIPQAVRQACQNLGHHPNKVEFDSLCQRIVMVLMDNGFHTLRSFSNDSKPQTWLFTITKRHIMHLLDKRKRETPLDDLPLDSFTTQPDQERKLISEEREKLLLTAVGKLTEHERKLFILITQGLKAADIAKELGIKKESVYVQKSALIKKLQNIINDSSMGNRKAKNLFTRAYKVFA